MSGSRSGALLAAFAAAALLTGCIPSLALTALGGLGGGGDASPAAPPANSYRAPTAAAAPPDRSVADAIRAADSASEQGVTEACAARLPPEPEGTPRCSRRPVCLPGAAVPVEMALCKAPEAGSPGATPVAHHAPVDAAGWDWNASP